jgi:hypothetical protein
VAPLGPPPSEAEPAALSRSTPASSLAPQASSFHMSSRTRNPTGHPGRLLLIVGSVFHSSGTHLMCLGGAEMKYSINFRNRFHHINATSQHAAEPLPLPSEARRRQARRSAPHISPGRSTTLERPGLETERSSLVSADLEIELLPREFGQGSRFLPPHRRSASGRSSSVAFGRRTSPPRRGPRRTDPLQPGRTFAIG